MTILTTPDRTCPYVGLLPFSTDDAEYFFGREKEIEILRLNAMAARSTLIYGATGVGKSSVINAGLFPVLDSQDDVIVAPFREWTADPVPGIKASVVAATKHKFKNFIGDTEISLSDTLTDVAMFLANNIDDPDELVQRPGRVVVILDQFDEYIINHELTPETEQSLAEAFRNPHPSVAVLVSIREDWLARLDRFLGIFPTLLDNIIRLEPLSAEGALAAIKQPVEKFSSNYPDAGPSFVEEQLVRAIIEQVQRTDVPSNITSTQTINNRIDTAMLQVVLIRLWNDELIQGSQSLRLDTLKRLGNATHILDEHLAFVFNQFTAEQQGQAVEMFDRLVTPSETKVAQSAEDLAAYLMVDTTQLECILNTLASPDSRILRSFAPRDRPESKRYELYHDLLAKPVRSWLVGRRIEAQVDEYLSQRSAVEAEADRRIIDQLPKGAATASELALVVNLPEKTVIDACRSLVKVGIVRTVGTEAIKYVFEPGSGYRKELFREPYAELLSARKSQKVTWLLGVSMIIAGCMTLALMLFHPLQLFGLGVIGELTDATAVLAGSAVFGALANTFRNWRVKTSKGLTSMAYQKDLFTLVSRAAGMAVFGLSFFFYPISYISGHGEWLRGPATLWIAVLCIFVGVLYSHEEFFGKTIRSPRRRQ